jgi:hypothetical protein
MRKCAWRGRFDRLCELESLQGILVPEFIAAEFDTCREKPTLLSRIGFSSVKSKDSPKSGDCALAHQCQTLSKIAARTGTGSGFSCSSEQAKE